MLGSVVLRTNEPVTNEDLLAVSMNRLHVNAQKGGLGLSCRGKRVS